MNKKIVFLVAIALFISTILYFYNVNNATESSEGKNSLGVINRLTSKSQFIIEGDKIKTKDNKKILFYVWEDNCNICDQILPHLKSLQDRNKDNLSVFIISNTESIKIKDLNVSTVKPDDSVRNVLKLAHSPYFIIYNADGSLKSDIYGVLPEEMLEFEIVRDTNGSIK